MLQPKNIHTKLAYLLRDDLYTKQKPFVVDFPVEDIPGAESTNHRFDSQELIIKDIRVCRDEFTLENNGFCFLREYTSLTVDNADDDDFVQKQYFKEIEALLHRMIPEYERIEYLDHQVRRRDSAFPSQPGAIVNTAQPAALPHSDFSKAGGFLAMEQFFPGQEKYYKDRDFDFLNVWRVLKGPNNDWPLAMCDYQSINLKTDLIDCDVLYEDFVGENTLLFKNPQHMWYYLSDQDEEDLIIFRNVDSHEKRAAAFHAAFNTGMEGTFPRQSMELRVVAFRH